MVLSETCYNLYQPLNHKPLHPAPRMVRPDGYAMEENVNETAMNSGVKAMVSAEDFTLNQPIENWFPSMFPLCLYFVGYQYSKWR